MSIDKCLNSKNINTLFIKMSLPIILGLIINSLYSVVDAIFVTRVIGNLAMAGVSVVFPLYMIAYAMAIMIGSGAASIIARRLGANRLWEAQQAATSALLLCLFSSIFLSLLLYITLPNTLFLLGASDTVYLLAKEYATPLVLSFPLMMMLTVLSELLRAEGKIKQMSGLLVMASMVNIILDALFIIVFEMGVFGAAFATIVAQVIALIMACYFYLANKTKIKLTLSKHYASLVRSIDIVQLGLPIFVVNAGVAVSIAVVNFSIGHFVGHFNVGNVDNILAAFGLNTRITLFAILPLLGMMIAFQTLAGLNYGAHKHERVRGTLLVACKFTSFYSLTITLIMLTIPDYVFAFFTNEQSLIKLAADMALLIFSGFFTMGLGFIVSAYFQTIGSVNPALVLSSARMFMFLIPLLLILPYYLGTFGIWLAYPVADILTLIMSVYFLIGINKALKLKGC